MVSSLQKMRPRSNTHDLGISTTHNSPKSPRLNTGASTTQQGQVGLDQSPPLNRDTLLVRYRQLVDRDLPAAARQQHWVIRLNHCFGRVLLDDAVGACWYDVLDRHGGAAYRQLDTARLAHVVATGERMLLEGDPLVRQLDARSLAWRGKASKRPGRAESSPARPHKRSS